MMSRDLLAVAQGYSLAGNPSTLQVETLTSDLQAQILPLACGLIRLGALDETLRMLGAQMSKDMRALVKRRPLVLAGLREAATGNMVEYGTGHAPDNGTAVAEIGGTVAEGQIQPNPGWSIAGAGVEIGMRLSAGAEEATLSASHTEHSQVHVADLQTAVSGAASSLLVLLRRAAALHTAFLKAISVDYALGNRVATGVPSTDGYPQECAERCGRQLAQQSAETLARLCELAQERCSHLPNFFLPKTFEHARLARQVCSASQGTPRGALTPPSLRLCECVPRWR
jgi:hypothetical protein